MTDAQIKALAEKAAEKVRYSLEWRGNALTDPAEIIAAVFTPAIREVGPCGKHPKLFWEQVNEYSPLAGVGRMGQAVPFEGHCTIYAEIQAQVAAALREAYDAIIAKWEKIAPELNGGDYQNFITHVVLPITCKTINDLIPDPSALDRRKP